MVPTFAEQGFPTIDDVAMMILWSRPDVPAERPGKVPAARVAGRPGDKPHVGRARPASGSTAGRGQNHGSNKPEADEESERTMDDQDDGAKVCLLYTSDAADE